MKADWPVPPAMTVPQVDPMPISRRLLLAQASLAMLVPDASAAPDDDPPLLAQDYAKARLDFRTRLVRTGPAPDAPQTMSAPPGTRPVAYRSGPLTLGAWISDNADAADPRPGVLVLHGGNALWQGHWDIARPFVDAGYVAMIPALRGENGLPGSFSGFYDETSDVLAAASALADQPGVDAGRLHIAGHSVGGTLTLLAAMSTDRFRGACAFAGNPDARAFFRRYPEDIRFDAGDAREFDMRSAACFASSFKCPLLMVHGSRENGAEPAVRLTAARAGAAGLRVERGIVDGDHMSAIPGECAEALRFFAAL